jgi:hypothetical protein
LDFFTQLLGACAQILSRNIMAKTFGGMGKTTEWTFLPALPLHIALLFSIPLCGRPNTISKMHFVKLYYTLCLLDYLKNARELK